MPRDTTPSAAATSPDGRLRVALGQASRAGPGKANQDFHGAMVPEGAALSLKGVALAVADGISSSLHGGEAAEVAVRALMTDYYDTPDAWRARTAAARVIAATNGWLWGRNRALSDIDAGRVCTLSALILKGREAHVLHVGDSRVWRVAGGTAEPLTADHRVAAGEGESWLARAMGAAPSVEIDARTLAVTEGDVFALTTDGVHEVLDGRAIARIVASELDLGAAAGALVAAARAAGSTDDATVQLVRIEALPPEGARIAPEAARLPVPPLPRAGEVLDGFRILRPIAQGARSHVFLAEGPDGARAALKIPAAETAADPAYLARFALEDWIARRVRSDHVVRAADSPAPRTALFVATEFVEGATLRQWLDDGPRPDLARVRDIAGQLVAGLRALHRREMIHQDLRPENVMIDADGRVRIVDLGSVTVAGIEEAAPGTLGDLPGTLQYTAPEYLSGDVVSWRSDLWSLGAIVYEMLTGRLPYGADVARVTSPRDRMRLRYRPARDEATGVPPWVDAALARALHPDPTRRQDALSEFLADLTRPGATARAATHVPLAQRHPVRFWQGVSAALAVLCLTLAARLGGAF